MNSFAKEVEAIRNQAELTDADVANIKAHGLRLVCKPDVKPSNVVELYPARRFVEPLDAA